LGGCGSHCGCRDTRGKQSPQRGTCTSETAGFEARQQQRAHRASCCPTRPDCVRHLSRPPAVRRLTPDSQSVSRIRVAAVVRERRGCAVPAFESVRTQAAAALCVWSGPIYAGEQTLTYTTMPTSSQSVWCGFSSNTVYWPLFHPSAATGNTVLPASHFYIPACRLRWRWRRHRRVSLWCERASISWHSAAESTRAVVDRHGAEPACRAQCRCQPAALVPQRRPGL
jgi:hypothetical protein